MQIPHNKPFISGDEVSAIANVISSGWIAEGPQVKALEDAFINLNTCGGACAVSSGTAGLFLALMGLNVKSGEYVAVPTYACSALLNAINMLGAKAIPVDVRSDNFLLDAEKVDTFASKATAVIAVHTFGAAVDIKNLKQLNIQIIEDRCQSLGSHLGDIGQVAVYSFYATKVITGGQGGLIWDQSGRIAKFAHDYRRFDCRKIYFPRFNFQMTDIQAALIISQIKWLGYIHSRRRLIYKRYLMASASLLSRGWRVQAGLEDDNRMPYRFVIIAPNKNRRQLLINTFNNLGIITIVPIQRYELLHRYLKLNPKNYPNGEMLAECAVSIPLYPNLTDKEVDKICTALNNHK